MEPSLVKRNELLRRFRGFVSNAWNRYGGCRAESHTLVGT